MAGMQPQIQEMATFELRLLDLEDEASLHGMLRCCWPLLALATPCTLLRGALMSSASCWLRREWAGEYELKWNRSGGDPCASLRFSSLRHLKAAAHSLAGGSARPGWPGLRRMRAAHHSLMRPLLSTIGHMYCPASGTVGHAVGGGTWVADCLTMSLVGTSGLSM